tara:strand:+ start:1004 stop:1354 length:351 start_codon:yes stop_codon:yes gene_type:complete
MNEKIKNNINNKIDKRLEWGAEKYNQELNVFDGRDWIKEAEEEIIDALVYLEAFQMMKKENTVETKNDYLENLNTLKTEIASIENDIDDALSSMQDAFDTVYGLSDIIHKMKTDLK